MTTPAPLPGHDGPVLGLSWSYDGRYLLSCSADKMARVWAMGEDHLMKHRSVLSFATMTHNFKEESDLATKVRDFLVWPPNLMVVNNHLLGIDRTTCCSLGKWLRQSSTIWTNLFYWSQATDLVSTITISVMATMMTSRGQTDHKNSLLTWECIDCVHVFVHGVYVLVWQTICF